MVTTKSITFGSHCFSCENIIIFKQLTNVGWKTNFAFFPFSILLYLREAASCRSAELPRLLGTASDGSVLLHILLGH